MLWSVPTVCTVLLLFQVVNEYPVVLSENRDTSLAKYVKIARVNYQALADRPPKLFYPPALAPDAMCDPASPAPVPFVGPFDVTNATWVGVNQHRVVLAVTNGYVPHPEPSAATRSRGVLAVEVLNSATSAQNARDLIEAALNSGEYKSSNFLVADAEQAWVIHYWGEAVEVCSLNPGIHVFGNYYFPDPHPGDGSDAVLEWLVDDTRIRMERGAELVGSIPEFQERSMSKLDSLAGIRAFITDHSGEPGRGISICRHAVDPRDYRERRTLSNTTICLHSEFLEQSSIYYNAGNPCAHKWQDRSFLLEPENFTCQFLEGEGEGTGGSGQNREGESIPQFGKFPSER